MGRYASLAVGSRITLVRFLWDSVECHKNRIGFSKTIIIYLQLREVTFVAEIKGNDIEHSQIRGAEDAKIECARCHFATISIGKVVYSVVKNISKLVIK